MVSQKVFKMKKTVRNVSCSSLELQLTCKQGWVQLHKIISITITVIIFQINYNYNYTV